jgi:hypothetical protein
MSKNNIPLPINLNVHFYNSMGHDVISHKYFVVVKLLNFMNFFHKNILKIIEIFVYELNVDYISLNTVFTTLSLSLSIRGHVVDTPIN